MRIIVMSACSASARATLTAVIAFAAVLGTSACGRQDSRPAASASADSLPLPSARLIELAADAEARLDSASTVRSGPRVCTAAGQLTSAACELELTVRRDVGDFGPGRVPGGFAVLALIRNIGDSTEASTGIPGRTTAYVLVRQGGPQRTSAWYYSIDQAQRRAVAIRRLEYAACPRPHEDTADRRAAWRRCPATLGVQQADTVGGPPPAWFTCLEGCCDLEN
jgi:hypothetical protein